MRLPKRTLLVLLTLLLAGCTQALPNEVVGPFKGDPSVTASVTVNGPDATVNISSQNFKVIPAAEATTAHTYGEGHYHVFLDVPPTAPGEVIPQGVAGIYHTAKSSLVINNVTTGHHTLFVELGFSDHSPYQQQAVSGAKVSGTLTKVEFDVSSGAVAQASPSPAASESAAPSPSTAPSVAASPSAAASGAPPSGGTKVSVLGDPTNGGKYDPSSLNVKVGDTVEWDFNDDSASHSVTDDSGAFDSGVQAKGFTFNHKYDKAGSFGYSCSVHPNMKGSVTVQ
jgi:plastocyanin